ncbi:glycine--tRNA ligase, beta subunit [Chlamydia ibidis]|uniref:Multifunctional fusion protein n=2 Tax=Chlamydia ibidis TaxID=1405396 RepID=S7J3J0_9CHLA|nr:glycine--tRNA ligase [Chlamydia ibidis]EPP34758.1 glycine--tRNA ligase, beta subunit [Chlamydia ibidis]EQM62386.1 glycine--tRNA ligase, beta subunit [Chlamydia ibidis 10-1398/6]
MSSRPLTLQSMIATILKFWSDHGCVIHQGYDLEVGAGTFNPATFLRALGPEPYQAAYVEPSRRPQDGRYGSHPNRLQNYHQLQVILKPVPDDFLTLYTESLKTIGLDLRDHDIRFVHDDWENPTIGAWGLGWEVWLNGMEITQLTYFQAIGSKPLDIISGEITYGIERIAMYLQQKNSVYDILWNDNLTYGDITQSSEKAWSEYNFDIASSEMWLKHFEDFSSEALRILDSGTPIPAYDFVIKASHAFNILDARGVISVTERTRYIARIRQLARLVADRYVEWRATLGYPLLGGQTKTTKKTITIPDFPEISTAQDFLLEIGSEELPATFVPIGMQQLDSIARKLFSDHNISYDTLEVLGSPRRISLLVSKLAPVALQPSTEKKGPMLSMLFSESGEVTSQGAQFFTSYNVNISHIDDLAKQTFFSIRDVKSVPYLFLIYPEKKINTVDILREQLPKLIQNIKFPKKMVWDTSRVEYARPIRWIVSLYGKDILPFTFGEVVAGRSSWGHRQLDPREIIIKSCESYVETLRNACVIISQQERRQIIEQGLKAHSSEEVYPIPNPRLLEEIVFLTEHPFVTSGRFNKEFCLLPKELLIAEMVNHQKYFPTQGKDGTISNHFILVCDNSPNHIITEGNEKALTPRLTDGRFLFDQDLKTPLSSFVEKLKSVTYFDALGSLYDKVERLKAHANIIYPLAPISSREDISIAVDYCKADLVSSVINEFPELQGIMGEYYLKHAGYSSAAAVAVGEHLRHITCFQEISMTGILLSIIDRLDNLLSCFILDLKPTSSHDPYALRRQSLEVLNMLNVAGISVNLEKLFFQLAENFPNTIQNKTWDKSKVINDLLTFIWGRLKTVLTNLGFHKDEISAVLSQTTVKNPLMSIRSCQVLRQMKSENKNILERIISTHNRLRKILTSLQISTNPVTLEILSKEESLLKTAIDNFNNAVKEGQKCSSEYLYQLAQLCVHIENFLNNVHIASSDETLKSLRIHLLIKAMESFSHYAWEELKV